MAAGVGSTQVSEAGNTKRGGDQSANIRPRRKGQHPGAGVVPKDVNVKAKADYRRRYGNLVVK